MSKKNALISIVRKLPPFLKHSIHFILEPKFRQYNNFLKIPKIYTKWVAPNLAFYIYWSTWFIFKFLQKKKIVFLANNISNSPGHVMQELDYFIRKARFSVKDQDIKYIIIWPRSEVAQGARNAYKKYVYKFYVSDILYALVLPFTIRYNDIIIDSSVSLVDKSINRCIKHGFRYLPVFSEGQRKFEDVWERLYDYYALRKRTFDFVPARTQSQIDPKLSRFIGIDTNKYALIQIKCNAGNGTAKPTEPITYVETIIFLQNSGLKVIFCGREKMPNIFRDFGVINYAEWEYSSFYYDLQLVEHASLVISSASGFANIPDTMEVPVVYTNQWNFNCPPSGRFTVTVPCLFYNQDNNPWKFSNQIDYFYKTRDSNSAVPEDKNPRNATGVEILEATKEALSLKQSFIPISELQYRFQDKFSKTPLGVSESRISQYFINNFKTCLD